jgi:hypothetical protein
MDVQVFGQPACAYAFLLVALVPKSN